MANYHLEQYIKLWSQKPKVDTTYFDMAVQDAIHCLRHGWEAYVSSKEHIEEIKKRAPTLDIYSEKIYSNVYIIRRKEK